MYTHGKTRNVYVDARENVEKKITKYDVSIKIVFVQNLVNSAKRYIIRGFRVFFFAC